MAANTGKIDGNMTFVGVLLFFLLGMAVGSFLNDVIDRLPNNESLILPPSHCPSCQRRLTVRDLIPIFSYLWLRGRCRYCQAPIPRRILWVEAGTSFVFGYLFWHYGLTMQLALAILYSALFIVLAVIDLEHGLILNRIVYPSAVVALVIGIFFPPSWLIYSGEMADLLANTFLPQSGIAQAAIGGVIGFILFSLIILVSRGGMGWGDAKMACLVGIITGYMVLLALFLAVILGGMIAIILLALKIRKRREGIPFGPFLSLGGVVTLLWGSYIVSWYLRLL